MPQVIGELRPVTHACPTNRPAAALSRFAPLGWPQACCQHDHRGSDGRMTLILPALTATPAAYRGPCPMVAAPRVCAAKLLPRAPQRLSAFGPPIRGPHEFRPGLGAPTIQNVLTGLCYDRVRLGRS